IADKIIEESIPKVTIDLLDLPAFNTWGIWKVEVKNNGVTSAINFKFIELTGDLELKNMPDPISLKPDESQTLEINCKPTASGNIPIDIIANYKDALDRSYEFKDTQLVQVGGAKPEVIASEVEAEIEIKRETEFYNGFIRMKIAVANTTNLTVNDVELDLDFEENILRIDRHEPEFQVKKGKIQLGNLDPKTSKTRFILIQ
ncbi:MAG: hypothetical protein ACE5KE_01740, partial [Methanosarcinales archaeon]